MNKMEIPFIKFDSDYFRTTVRNESRYPLAWRWVKETLQNAVDAKSTNITFVFNKKDKTFEVSDDGVGMDEDIVLNKFLALGGSKKTGKSVGGFGDAKKVICFCWDYWELESNRVFLSSDMLGKEPVRKRKFSKCGTRIKANLGDCFDVDQAIDYINLCELSVNVKVFVVDENGSRSEIKLYKFMSGKPLDSLDFGALYIAKSTNRKAPKLEVCVVRVKGLAMFYIPLQNFKNDMVFELSGLTSPKDSEYILNVQREGLRWKEEYKLDSLIRSYISEPHKLKGNKNDYDDVVIVERGIGLCESMRTKMYVQPETIDVNSEPVQGKEISSASNLEFGAFFDVYPYDFIVKGKTALRYNGVKYKRLCLMWHKFIQYIIFWNLDAGNNIDVGDYKIGFTFPSEKSIKAQYVELADGTPCFLLNPDISITDSWRGVVLEIMDRAIHEITHRFYPHHDGGFIELYNTIKSVCYMQIEDFFELGRDILKSNKDNLYKMARMDETYEQY